MLRAYIGREWDRIESVGGDARRELDEYLDSTRRPTASKTDSEPAPVKRIEAVKEETEVERAYKILKLEPNATLADLKRSFKTLSERSLPTNFPEGSEEREKAQDIHERVQKAYDLLLPILDPRLRRFKSLWLE